MERLSLLFIAFLFLCGCAELPRVRQTVNTPIFPIAVYDVFQYEQSLTRTNVSIARDPVYGRPKKYSAVPLQPLFDLILKSEGPEVALVFRCLDGYAPIAMLADIVNKQGFVALRDEDAKTGSLWEPFAPDRSPAPYYVVWPALGTERVPWPYQLITIEVYSANSILKQSLRQSVGSHRNGRQLFLRSCVACHALAAVGGTLGPDLAAPTNVTKYWRNPYLRQFIKNPSSIRHNSKMPDLHLTDKEIDEVISFLREL